METENRPPSMTKNPMQDTEEIIRLIELVKTYPCLWKDSDRQYKNIELRHQAWEEIGTAMDRSLEVVKAKWKNLLNCYRRTRKEIQRSQVTGSGSNDFVPNWYAYEHMAFLHDINDPRPTVQSGNLAGRSTSAASTSAATTSAATTATASITDPSSSVPSTSAPSTSNMLPGRPPNPRKRKHDTRLEQISSSMANLEWLKENANVPRPMTKAKAMGNLVEAQIATFEQSNPRFCARLIQVMTTAMNEEIEKFYATGTGDHDYL